MAANDKFMLVVVILISWIVKCDASVEEEEMNREGINEIADDRAVAWRLPHTTNQLHFRTRATMKFRSLALSLRVFGIRRAHRNTENDVGFISARFIIHTN